MTATGELTAVGRYIILAAAFLGWAFSGFQMAVMTLTARSATTEFLRRGQLTAAEPLVLDRLWVVPKTAATPLEPVSGEAEAWKASVPRWLSWYYAAF